MRNLHVQSHSAWAFAVLAALALAGCVQVSASGTNDIEQGFGVVEINLAPGDAAQIVRLDGFGLVLAPGGFTLGWTRATYVTAPPACQLVVWIENSQQAQELLSLLGGRSDVCRITDNGGRQ